MDDTSASRSSDSKPITFRTTILGSGKTAAGIVVPADVCPDPRLASMSLDGFIAGPDDGPDQGLGRDGEILHSWPGSGGAGCGQFVPTHRAPVDHAARGPWVSYVTDGIESAMAQAKAAAGEANVLVHGAETAQLGPGHIELDLIRIIDAPGITHLRYRVQSTETTKERP